MNLVEALILGIVQGIAEFLPISSSGHLVLLQKIFGISEGALTFDIAVHFATLVAVFIFFRKDFYHILKRPFSKITLLLIIGTIPVGIVAFIFGDFIESIIVSGAYLGIAFLVTGLILFLSDRSNREGKGIEKLSILDAVIIGLFQAIAIVPGISRSGTTISGGLFRGMQKTQAVKFAFILGTPAILGATLKDLLNVITDTNSTIDIVPLIVGMLAAGILGYITIKFMMSIFMKIKMKTFAYYVVFLGVLVLADQIFFNIFFDKIF